MPATNTNWNNPVGRWYVYPADRMDLTTLEEFKRPPVARNASKNKVLPPITPRGQKDVHQTSDDSPRRLASADNLELPRSSSGISTKAPMRPILNSPPLPSAMAAAGSTPPVLPRSASSPETLSASPRPPSQNSKQRRPELEPVVWDLPSRAQFLLRKLKRHSEACLTPTVRWFR